MISFQPTQDMLYHYIQRKLSPTDEERVELWLMDHPEAVEDLTLDLILQEGLQEISPKAADVSRTQTFSRVSWIGHPAVAGLTAVAVLAAIATTSLYLAADDRNMDLMQRLAQLEQEYKELRGVTFVDVPVTRGSSGVDARFVDPGDDSLIVFRVFVIDRSYSSYQVRIVSDDVVVAGPRKGLQLDADHSLATRVNASLLPAKFQLEVFGERDGTVTKLKPYVLEKL